NVGAKSKLCSRRIIKVHVDAAHRAVQRTCQLMRLLHRAIRLEREHYEWARTGFKRQAQLALGSLFDGEPSINTHVCAPEVKSPGRSAPAGACPVRSGRN